MMRNISKMGILFMVTLAAGWLVVDATSAFAKSALVEVTGQSTSFAPGDDGAIHAGAPLPSPRFADNGDGTVKDNATNLIWLKNTECFGAQTWPNALNAVNALASGACDLTDRSVAGNWRLPNVRELQSIIDFGTFNPALPSGHPFAGVQPAVYWTSTTIADDPGLAWSISMVVGSPRPSGKADSGRVWAVRGNPK